MNGFWAILFKEFAHIRRERLTIFFAFVVPVLQMTIFGFAIKVTIDHIPLAVFDLDGRQESRRLVEALDGLEGEELEIARVLATMSHETFDRLILGSVL